MTDDTYLAVLDYLYQQLPMFQRQGAVAFKKDLTNTLKLCKVLGNPQNKFTSIHIAGTNGKGTTSHILSAIFQAAGYTVGVYTSPHYLDIRERIKINNKLIPKERLISFVEKLKPHLKDIKPSFFEMMVAMAFDYFAEEKVDIAIIETGLGGRLDSTNVLYPTLSVITNISYDHQDMLGETLSEIAAEKAGIIKSGVPVVIGETQEEIKHVFIEKASLLNAPIFFADQSWSYVIKFSGLDHYILDIIAGDKVVFSAVKVDLKGEILLKNMITAIKTVIEWNVNNAPILPQHIISGLANIRELTYFIGRMQVLGSAPLLIADSAHNQDGLSALFSEIERLQYEQLHIVFGMVADKPIDKIIDTLPKKATYYAVAAEIPRAKPASKLFQELQIHGFDVLQGNSVENGKKMALRQSNPEDLVLICGSIFVVAELAELSTSL